VRSLADVIGLDGLDYSNANYVRHERDLLTPRLERLGYTYISWSDGERDSFGPLTRICTAMDPEGRMVEFVYG
jgi:hypothetical protein